jgi:hypothetical protein
MMIDHRHPDSGDDSDNSRRESPSPTRIDSSVDNQSYSSVNNSPGHPGHQETPLPPVPDLTVSPTAVDADMPSTSSSSPASPVTSPNASPSSDSSTRLSAIQTVQTYLTQQAQLMQSHLAEVLPDLIRGEVHVQCSQLSQEITAQIYSIREEVNRPTGDQDDLMSPFSEEGENEGSRGHGKQSAKCVRDKGKGKGGRFATESDNEAAETRRHHHRSQQPNNGDEHEADNEGEDETDEEGISTGSRKYKMQMQALRVSIHLALDNEY